MRIEECRAQIIPQKLLLKSQQVPFWLISSLFIYFLMEENIDRQCNELPDTERGVREGGIRTKNNNKMHSKFCDKEP
jgi:hypothetical protein